MVCTILRIRLQVEMVDWSGHAADLAYGCGSGIGDGRTEHALEDEQDWCEEDEHVDGRSIVEKR